MLIGDYYECGQTQRLLVLQGPFLNIPSFESHRNLVKYAHFTGSKKLWRREGRRFARNETEIIKSRTTNSECKTPLHPLTHK